MSVLLLAIGNPLRGDDGVGPFLLADWRRGDGRQSGRRSGQRRVRSLQASSQPQLTPDLAERLQGVSQWLLLDAWCCVDPTAQAQLRLLQPRRSAAGWCSHQLEAEELLALVLQLQGVAPRAHHLLIPAFAFPYTPPQAGRAAFSSLLRARLPRARRLLRRWCHRALAWDA